MDSILEAHLLLSFFITSFYNMSIPVENVILTRDTVPTVEQKQHWFIKEVVGTFSEQDLSEFSEFITVKSRLHFAGQMWVMLDCGQTRRFYTSTLDIKSVKNEIKYLMRACYNEDDELMKQNVRLVLEYYRELVGMC